MEDALASPVRGDRHPHISRNPTDMPSSLLSGEHSREHSGHPEPRQNIPRLPIMPVISCVEDGPAIVSRKQGKGGVRGYAELCWRKVWERNLSVSEGAYVYIYVSEKGKGEEGHLLSAFNIDTIIYIYIYIYIYTIMHSQETEFSI
jgi:hypothetical protein